MLALVDNGYFKEGSVEYLDQDDKLQRAIRRGISKNIEIGENITYLDSDELMWEEQLSSHDHF
ncbi:hypothetical protein HBN50_03340 [Halobacteriovorax sp. GB3]|uniref:hypothetical protein n=1 Tax=Halobacteriovorax sp. GB3 TaxID=2719615 RepID=UPI002361B041|nr:hypothetical protein [Halobacteriovorax sp. GB3]MDD0852111.1 hypothetical protein [Halobacteriovorax sp. GB3]